MDILNYKLQQLSSLIREKKLSAKKLCSFYLDRIEKYNAELNAVLTLNPSVLQSAENIDKKFNTI